MKRFRIIHIFLIPLIFTLFAGSFFALLAENSLGEEIEIGATENLPVDGVMGKGQEEPGKAENNKNNAEKGFLKDGSEDDNKKGLLEVGSEGDKEKGLLIYEPENEVNDGLGFMPKAKSSNDEDDSGDLLFKPANFTSIIADVDEKDMQKIKPGVETKGSIKTRGDKQFYIFTVPTRGYIELEFRLSYPAASPVPSWDTYLYEAYNSEGSGGERRYRELTILRSLNDNAPALSNRVGVYPGTYVIMVTNTSSHSTATYYLKANFVQDYNYEAECNDSIYRYNQIYSGRPIKGSSSFLSTGKDVDYFMFEMDKKGYVEISFTHPVQKLPAIAWRVSMFDSQGRILYAARSSMQDDENLSGAIGLKEGIYFIEVASHEYFREEYSLRVDITADNNYEAEPNDTFELANVLQNNKPIKGSLSLRSSPMERDFYKINMPKNGYLQVFFEHEGPTREIEGIGDKQGWNIYLYNSKEEVIFFAISTWFVHELSMPKIGLPAGDYYISIDADQRHHNHSTYTIKAKYEITKDWEIEDNNSHLRANPLLVGSSIHGSLVSVDFDFDVDYFVFELEKEATIHIDFEHDKIPGNEEGWHVALLNSSLQELESVSSRWSDEYLTFSRTLRPGKYYIKIDIKNGMSPNFEEYRLTVRK